MKSWANISQAERGSFLQMCHEDKGGAWACVGALMVFQDRGVWAVFELRFGQVCIDPVLSLVIAHLFSNSGIVSYIMQCSVCPLLSVLQNYKNVLLQKHRSTEPAGFIGHWRVSAFLSISYSVISCIVPALQGSLGLTAWAVVRPASLLLGCPAGRAGTQWAHCEPVPCWHSD